MFPAMNDPAVAHLVASLLALAAVLAGCLAIFHWMRVRSREREDRLRAQGYRLIHALGAYSAWIDAQREAPITARSLEELTSPEPLTRARRIRGEHFPELAAHMLRLLQSHSRVMEYHWQQSLLRLTQGAAWVPAHHDTQYLQLRAAQEDLIDEMVVLCRELVGDSPRRWHATGSDFAFSTGFGMAGTGPASRA
jgi:hypothetical protein